MIPDEEAVPAAFLGSGSQAGSDPRVGKLAKQSNVDSVLHNGILTAVPEPIGAVNRIRLTNGPAPSETLTARDSRRKLGAVRRHLTHWQIYSTRPDGCYLLTMKYCQLLSLLRLVVSLLRT